MNRYIVILLSIVLSLGCYAQRKNNNIGAASTQQATPKNKATKKIATPQKPQTQKPKMQVNRPQTSKPKPSVPSSASGTIAGYEYVDLGLPSGLKWATCNVGASCPEGYGSYFAWSETRTKSSYDSDNCPTYGKDNFWLRSKGYIDYSGNLTPVHDAARANWGSTWRMPTKAEIQELVDNSTTTWTTYNGVNGRLITSKRNGNSIFLPAAGYRSGTSLYYECGGGYCWSSTPYEGNTYGAYFLYFYSYNFDWRWNYRYLGLSVRPVSD